MGWEARFERFLANRLAATCYVLMRLPPPGGLMALSPLGLPWNVPVLPLCHEPAHASRACRAGFLKQMFVEAIVNILNIPQANPDPLADTITASASATPILQQLQDLLKALRVNAQGRPELETLSQQLDQRYLDVDESITRGTMHLHYANQSLHALLTLLQSCPEDSTLNCDQIVTLLEPVRQELQTSHRLICSVM
ncbi:hypothetical protein CH06BL_00080 [Chromobacterium haemolyticum]|nr:hypothetical protein CH06BL_00080 [Chromobacterium haemolyticum]